MLSERFVEWGTTGIFILRWVCFISGKNWSNLVFKLYHENSRSFTVLHNLSNHSGIILAQILNAFLFPYYNQQIMYGFPPPISRRSQVQILAPLPKYKRG